VRRFRDCPFLQRQAQDGLSARPSIAARAIRLFPANGRSLRHAGPGPASLPFVVAFSTAMSWVLTFLSLSIFAFPPEMGSGRSTILRSPGDMAASGRSCSQNRSRRVLAPDRSGRWRGLLWHLCDAHSGFQSHPVITEWVTRSTWSGHGPRFVAERPCLCPACSL
jgi:hypothetical protein